jgi:hypothetical protein
VEQKDSLGNTFVEQEPTVPPVAPDRGIQPALEDYLDHVCAPLVGVVPYATRQQLRAELQAHLEALAASHVELGSAPDEAVVAALRQFGDPRAISMEWTREWLRPTHSRPVQPAWRATGVALGCFGLASLISLLLFQMSMAGVADGGINTAPFVLFMAGGLLPVLAGLTTGLLAPARHALGTFFALALLIPPFAALGSLPLLQTLLGSHWANSGMAMAFTLALFWLQIGPLTAALGGLLQGRLGLRPQRWVMQ